MPCIPFQTPHGGGFMCTGRTSIPTCACGARAPLLCDWKTPSNDSGTCDAPICDRCASSPAPGKDLCPEHTRAWRAWPGRRAAEGAQA